MGDLKDEQRTCDRCKQPFLFTAGEQAFFSSKGFTPPKRCKTCRDALKAEREAKAGGVGATGADGYAKAPYPVQYQAPTPTPPPDDDYGNRKGSKRRRRNDD